MFFRLSKNVVKNAVFSCFGGGYPPSPLNSLYIASAYVFIEKSLNFIKKLLIPFIFLLFFGGGWVWCRRHHPPSSDWGVPNVKRRWGEKMVEVSGNERLSSLCFENSSTKHHPEQCSDEEHSTWSGGTITQEWGTARLAQGSEGSQKLWHIMRTSTSHISIPK
jgi:hypothetical protein